MYVNLFLRTLSQALQALTPIALSLTWFERAGLTSTSSAIRRGLLVSIPATVIASSLLQHSTHQALDEAVLAAITVAVICAFILMVWHRRAALSDDARATGHHGVSLWVVTTLAAFIVVRQTMEIGAVLETAAIELRLFSGTITILSALTIGGVVAWAMRQLFRRLPGREFASATWAFVLIFLVQGVIYAFHEFTEARLMPGSDALHSATEAFGPDGTYGVHLSDLLVIAPFVAAAITFRRFNHFFRARFHVVSSRRLAISGLGLVSFALIGLQGTDSAQPRDRSTSSQIDIAAIAAQPHLLFRDLTRTGHFGMLSLAPLDSPDSRRVSTSLPCERVSFAAGHGLCLRTVPGIFFHYTGAVLDSALRSFASIPLEGRPSRTRTSPDGRIGAITVFVFGDRYAAPFSTRTTLVDMSSAEVIGELEKFSTWRDGVRFRAVDFNFWGVTFANDDNTFYASLSSGGSIYLVRGELALRKLTVLRDNVECPSLSPDNRLVAFKKHIGRGAGQWRLAVLDLNTMTERMISSETRWIDDQVEWLDSRHVLYAVPGETTSIPDVWVAPIEGNAPARLFLPQAESPIVVR
jgi:hypothetical protein